MNKKYPHPDSAREEGEGNALTQPCELWRDLQDLGRRAAGGRCWNNGTGGYLRNRETGQCDWTEMRVESERNPFEHLSSRAHPRAQRARMGGGVMVCMVPSVGDCLWIDQPAEEQQTDRQADRSGSLKGSVHPVSPRNEWSPTA